MTFQDNQKDLENATEQLSEYLERDITCDMLNDIKQKVQDKYRWVCGWMLGLLREKYSILKKVVEAFSIIYHHTLMENFFFNFSKSFCKTGVGLYWSSSLFQVRIHLFCLLSKLLILFPYKKTRNIFNWLQIHWTPKRRSLLLHYEPSTMLIFCALRVTCPLM